jgi:RNA polymerase sigma-70 factor, ECF subfamily
MKTEQAALIRRARKGDADAFAEAFEPLRSMVYAVAYRLVGPDDAEDVVMQTYLKAWQAIPRFGGRSALKTWLYRITRNCALDSLRSRGRRRERVLSQEELDGPAVQFPDLSQATPDEIIARSETAAFVQAAMLGLSPEHRTALQMRFTDGMSYGEIAAATGVAIGTVMSRLFNAKRKLRVILENEADS